MFNPSLYGPGGMNGYGYGAQSRVGDISGYNAYLNQMQGIVPQAQSFSPNPPPARENIVTRQVTSVEEARAVIPEPMTTYLFPDTSTGKIYMKRMGANGMSEFYTYAPEPYEKKEVAVAAEASAVSPLEEINERLANIEAAIGGLKNDKSVPNVRANAKPDAGNARKPAADDDGKDALAKSTAL